MRILGSSVSSSSFSRIALCKSIKYSRSLPNCVYWCSYVHELVSSYDSLIAVSFSNLPLNHSSKPFCSCSRLKPALFTISNSISLIILSFSYLINSNLNYCVRFKSTFHLPSSFTSVKVPLSSTIGTLPFFRYCFSIYLAVSCGLSMLFEP